MIFEIFPHLVSSLTRVSLGVFLGVCLGIFFAVVRSTLPPWLRRNFFISFVFEFLRFPPPIAWIPFVILWLGIGSMSTLAIVVIASFPIMLMNCFEGIERIPLTLQRTANSLPLSNFERVKKLYLPSILPHVFLGLRQSLGLGWMSIIAAEMIGGQEGLGYAIQLSRLNLQYQEMVLLIFTIGIVGFFFHWFLQVLERKLFPWSTRREE